MSFGTKNNNKAQTGLSKETQALLEDAMKKRGLSQRAMADVAESIKSGDANWVDRISTGMASQKSHKSVATVKVPKVGRGGPSIPVPPSSFSGKKMLPAIMRDTPSEREQFVGGAPLADPEGEKDRLAMVMEHGRRGVMELQQKAAQQRAVAAKRRSAAAPPDPKEALIDQIIAEIQERREFLEGMRDAGQGSAYENQIRSEISTRLAELRRLGLDTSVGKPSQR